MAKLGTIQIKRIKVADLKPADYNPRKKLQPTDPEYQSLKKSIETFGYVDPLVWNKRTGNLIGGHQRLAVIVQENGATEVDVSVVDVDEAHEKALNVALNKVAGAWDDAALAELLQQIAETDIDIEATGFDEAELMALLNDEPTALTPLEARPPPKMAWVLIGIPSVRYGEIAERVEQMSTIDGVICEMTMNDKTS